MSQQVQVFLRPNRGVCEINGTLRHLRHDGAWVIVEWEESEGYVIEHRIPDSNISMIRIYEDQ